MAGMVLFHPLTKTGPAMVMGPAPSRQIPPSTNRACSPGVNRSTRKATSIWRMARVAEARPAVTRASMPSTVALRTSTRYVPPTTSLDP